jgi:hypothetical protein
VYFGGDCKVIDLIFNEGRKTFIKQFKAWHARVDAEDLALERGFTWGSIESIVVNVWDDYAEGEQTYAYVEMDGLPRKVELDVLIHLLGHARQFDSVQSGELRVSLAFVDSSVKFPQLIGKDDAELSLYKRWQLTIDGASHAQLESFVESLQSVSPLNGKPIEVISES